MLVLRFGVVLFVVLSCLFCYLLWFDLLILLTLFVGYRPFIRLLFVLVCEVVVAIGWLIVLTLLCFVLFVVLLYVIGCLVWLVFVLIVVICLFA